MPNPIHAAIVAFRWCVIGVLAAPVFAPTAQAYPAKAAAATSILGVYNGTCAGAQGPIKLKLSLTRQDNIILSGEWTVYLPDGSGTKDYTCSVSGVYNPTNQTVRLSPGNNWQPPLTDRAIVLKMRVVMAGMTGVFDPQGGNGAGQISGKMLGRPGPQFQAIRDVTESAKPAAGVAAKNPAAAPGAPATQPAGRPAAPNRAAPAPSSPAPPSPAPSLPAPPSSPAPPSAPAPGTDANSPTAINGVYTGEIKRRSGTLKLTFSIKATDNGSLTALFTFDAPANNGPVAPNPRGRAMPNYINRNRPQPVTADPPADKGGASITYKLTGKYIAGRHDDGLESSPYQFTTIEPVGKRAEDFLVASNVKAIHVGITGPDSIGGSMTGTNRLRGEFNGGWITATKDRAASADLDKAMSAQASAATGAAGPIVRRPFEGVYNGTYADEKGQTNKLKLTLWVQREIRTADGKLLKTKISGLLTVVASGGHGTMPYTSEVDGTYDDAHQTIGTVAERWDPPVSSGLLTTGISGKLDLGGGGNAAPQISGSLQFPQWPSPNTFHAVRDATESTNMDYEHLRNHVHPGIVGVFNGTYTRENGPPAQFKLTVTRNKTAGQGLGLDGLATIYLPTDSGARAYSYDLKGVEDYDGTFELRVHDWVSPPPTDFKEFRSMGFNGKVVLNDALTSARITSTPPARSAKSDFLPQFEATYDTSESADINGAIAAQKAIGSAEQVAALKARDEMMKKAPPKELASKDRVRKSRHYWEGFQNDMIREVFDGGFGVGINDNEEFQKVFCTYVETAAKCPECLPANHQPVTVRAITSMSVTENQNWHTEADRWNVNKTETTFTVEVDPRFVARYRQFVGAQAAATPHNIAIVAVQGAQRLVQERMSIVNDVHKFFADHPGKSAAMRQMNENFLRAINDEPSLQQAGAKIEGAEAESDKNVLPGRYARFVDGANAYFRERAKSNPTKFGGGLSHDTALCQRLAELYEFHMTRDEEYYYANDFEKRFVPIMGPRANCPDPAWPQLHPDVETALAQVK